MTDTTDDILDLFCFAIPPRRIGAAAEFPPKIRGWLICCRHRGHFGPHESWFKTTDETDLTLTLRWVDDRPIRLDVAAQDRAYWPTFADQTGPQ